MAQTLLSLRQLASNILTWITGQFKDSITVGASNADILTGDYASDDLAVQAALDLAASQERGLTVLIDPIYTFAGSVDIPDTVTLTGRWNGYFSNKTLITTNSAIDLITISTTSVGGLQNVKIDGNNKLATSGIKFIKNALPKIKGTLLRDVFVTQCQTGIDASSTGIASGPFDDTEWTNIRISNCDVGYDCWNVFGGIVGGSIGGCNIGVYLRTSSALSLLNIIFSQNAIDFSLDNQSPFSCRIANCYFEGTSVAHMSRNGVTSTSSLGAIIFDGCTFLNTIGAGPALDFTYATGRVEFRSCRFDSSAPNSNIVATNANTFVTVFASQTSVEPSITGSGRVSTYGTGADIRNNIINRSMNDIGGGVFWTTALLTNILSILRRDSPSTGSVVFTALGAIALKTGTSTPATSNLDVTVKTSGIVNIRNVPSYADNAAALAGGLVAGDLYQTSGTLKIVI